MMFCNSCGNEIKEGAAFCPKCGTQVAQNQETVCEKCGQPLESGAKFCQGCGQAVISDKKAYCQYCGQKMEENERFCSKCGHGRRSIHVQNIFNAKSGNGNGATGAHDSPVLLDRVKSPLGIKYLILTGLLLLSFVFMLIPSFALDIEDDLSLWLDKDFSTSFSLVDPCSKDMESLLEIAGSDGEDTVLALDIMGVVFLLPALFWFGLSIAFTIVPLFKNTLAKRRIFILQIYTSISYIFTLIIWWIIYALMWSDMDITVEPNFAYVMNIILLLATAVVAVWLTIDSKKYMTNPKRGRI